MKRNRICKAEGKTLRYREEKKKVDLIIRRAKEDYLGCIVDKAKFAGNTREFYKAVKLLRTKNAPIVWDIHSMFPGDPDTAICEQIACFFNKISLEYDPITNPEVEEKKKEWPVIFEPYQVAARLKAFRKPKSQVPGDINPVLVDKYYDLLALPLANNIN